MKNRIQLLSLAITLIVAFPSAALSQTITPGTFYKHFSGNINKTLSITMDLSYNGKAYSGFYYYESKRIPILVSGEPTPNGGLTLQESVEGETTGYFNGTFTTDNLLSGTWSNKDKTKSFPFTLVEDYSKGSIPLTFTGIEHVALLDPSKTGPDDPNYHISQFVHLPDASGGVMAAKVQAFMGDSLLGKGTNEGDIEGVLMASVKEMSDSYLELKDSYDGEDSYSFTWESELHTNVMVNDNHLLCLSSGGYEYTGGAHGSYWTGFQSADLLTGKALAEADIFIPGYTSKLIPLLEGKYREVYEISPSEPLSEILFVEHIEPNGNFYLTPDGLGWVYNIYEIQSYAQGAADLFFKWDEIAPFVKSDSPVQRLIKASQHD